MKTTNGMNQMGRKWLSLLIAVCLSVGPALTPIQGAEGIVLSGGVKVPVTSIVIQAGTDTFGKFFSSSTPDILALKSALLDFSRLNLSDPSVRVIVEPMIRQFQAAAQQLLDERRPAEAVSRGKLLAEAHKFAVLSHPLILAHLTAKQQLLIKGIAQDYRRRLSKDNFAKLNAIMRDFPEASGSSSEMKTRGALEVVDVIGSQTFPPGENLSEQQYLKLHKIGTESGGMIIPYSPKDRIGILPIETERQRGSIRNRSLDYVRKVAFRLVAATTLAFPALAQARNYYGSYDFERPVSIIREAMLPEYGFSALGVGAITAVGVAVWKAARSSSIPPTRRGKGWVGMLKSLGAGAAAAAATFGGRLSYDVFSSPADLWIKIAVGVAWTLITVAVGFKVDSIKKNRIWSSSKSAGEVIQIEEARARGDAAVLDRLAHEARERYGRIMVAIHEAEKSGSKTVNNKTSDSVKLAKHYAAFDLLVAGRAELNEDVVSSDPRQRIGGELPATWKERLSTDESEAKKSGFEGKLALRLKKFAAEITAERTAGDKIGTDISNFEQFIPKLFGGQMAQEAKRANDDLAKYRADEVETEQKLYDETNTAMRRRVSDRIYSESAEFRQHRDRFDRLAVLYNGPVHSAVETAHYIDDELSSAISNLQSEQTYLALAAANTAVPVVHTRTSSNGQIETYTTIEDHSGPYRAMAMSAAAAASANASAAREGFSRLPGLIVALHNDPTMESENLRGMIPQGESRHVAGGNGLWLDWILPPLFGMFSAMGSQISISNTRNALAPVLSALGGLSHEVASRRDGEDRWVNTQIDADLDKQMERAGPLG